MKTVIEHADLIAAVKSGDLNDYDILAALRAWIDLKEGQGYDTLMVNRHLGDLAFEVIAGMPWVGSKPAAPPAGKCPVPPSRRPRPYGLPPRDPYQ